MEKKELRSKLVKDMTELDAKAKTENRSFSEDETRSFSDMKAQVEKLDAEIAEEERNNTLKGFSSQLPAKNEKTAENRSFLNVVNGANGVEVRTDMTLAAGGSGLAPAAFYDRLEEIVQKETQFYGLVNKISVNKAGSLGVPYEAADASGANWTAEVPNSDISADSSWNISKRTLNPTDLTKLIKISKKLLACSADPVDTLAQNKIGKKLAQAFENGILNGSGSSQPLGVFTASADGVSTGRDVSTSGTGGAITTDDILAMYYKLRPAYRKNAVWAINTAILKDIMSLKDSSGKPLWLDSFRVGQPSTLLGLPVYESEFAPSTKTTGSYIAVLGDFSRYDFAEFKGIDITVATESFAGKNQIGIYGHTLADGAPIMGDAFARLKYVVPTT